MPTSIVRAPGLFCLVLVGLLPASAPAQARKAAGVAAGVEGHQASHPPAAPSTLPEKVTPQVAIPGGSGVLYPTSPSPFVALGNNEEDDRLTPGSSTCWAWAGRSWARSGARSTSATRRSSAPTASTCWTRKGSKDDFARGVQVWSFQTGCCFVGQFDVSDHPAFIYLMDFAGPGRVVTTLSHGSGRLDVWDINTGKKALGIAGDSGYGHAEAAFSPGRKYLAVSESVGNHIKIYDLTLGSLAGDLAPPTDGNGSAQRTKALSFSPDGTELCGLFDAGRDTRMVVWTVARPEVVVDHTFVGDPKGMAPGSFSYKGPPIEWLPDGSAWLLYGHVLFDRAGGRPVWMFRTEIWFHDPGTRRMIDNDRLLIACGPDRAKRLEVVVVPWRKIDAALEGGWSARSSRPWSVPARR